MGIPQCKYLTVGDKLNKKPYQEICILFIPIGSNNTGVKLAFFSLAYSIILESRYCFKTYQVENLTSIIHHLF